MLTDVMLYSTGKQNGRTVVQNFRRCPARRLPAKMRLTNYYRVSRQVTLAYILVVDGVIEEFIEFNYAKVNGVVCKIEQMAEEDGFMSVRMELTYGAKDVERVINEYGE